MTCKDFKRFASPYDGSFFGLLATRNNSLLAFGLRGHVFRSTDQGASWQPVAVASSKSLTAATQLRDGSLLLADESGQGWLSRDDGRSFRPVAPEQRFPLIALSGLARWRQPGCRYPGHHSFPAERVALSRPV